MCAGNACGHGAGVGASEVCSLPRGWWPSTGRRARWSAGRSGPGRRGRSVISSGAGRLGRWRSRHPTGKGAGTGAFRFPHSLPVDSLAIVSFNVNLGAASAIELVDSLRAGAFTAGAPVTDFILLLQETIREGEGVPDRVPKGSGTGRGVFPAPVTGRAWTSFESPTRSGFHLFYGPAMRSGKGRNPGGLPEDRGNAMLSTRPLGGLVMVELPFGGARRVASSPGYRAGRGRDEPGRSRSGISTSTSAPSAPRPSRRSAPGRLAPSPRSWTPPAP